MKKLLQTILVCCCLCALHTHAQQVQERLIYTTSFQDWAALGNSATETVLEKQTAFSNETLVFKLKNITVDPSGTNSKFVSPATIGYAMCAKTADTYIELGPLKSVTKLSYVHCATGSNRGYKLEKKEAGDADWVMLSQAVANPAGGVLVSVDVNSEDVSFRFTNLNASNNAYLTELNIHGNVAISAPQVSLATGVAPLNAGKVSYSPAGTDFDENTPVTFSATPEFGYRFNRWIDENGVVLSAENPFTLVLDEDKTVIAEFNSINTYSLGVEVSEGALVHQVAVSPAGKMIEGIRYYEEGTEVALSAAGNKIFTFNYWEDRSTAPVRSLVMDGNKVVRATFSNADYIVGWDLIADEPKTERSADYFSDAANVGKLSLRNANGDALSWLAKGSAKYEGRPAIVSWREFSEQAYYEISFSTQGYRNIRLSSAMLSHYNGYKVQNIEWSVDGTAFLPLGTITFDQQKTWYDSEVVLPSEAENQPKVYVRWIPDYESEHLLNSVGSTKDGTAITDIYLLADKETVADPDGPILVSSIPANNGVDVSASGSIILVFNEKVKAGTGDITLDNEVLPAIFNGTTVVFKYAGLAYGQVCHFVVPAGAITDMSGNDCEPLALSFTTMNRTQPQPRLYDFVVGSDANDDGKTIASAIQAAPIDGSRFLVFIKNGVYNERISVGSAKNNLCLVGQSRDGVIVNGAAYSGDANGSTTSNCQTVEILANNFYAENITIRNSAGMNAGQAVALKDYGDRNVYFNVKLLGYQDTHLTGNGRQYYQQCQINGTVDFIFGGGDVFFDRCLLYLEDRANNVVVAPSSKADTQWGYVFSHCTIDGAAINNNGFSLGRPWQNAPRAVYLNTQMNVLPNAAGWASMGVVPAIFAEYNSVNKSGSLIDLSNRTNRFTVNGSSVEGAYNPVLTDSDAGRYTIKNVLGGSDSWMPSYITERVAAPNIRLENKMVSWTSVDYAICYVVTCNGQVVAFTTATNYEVNGAPGTYSVQAVNEYGGLSESSDVVNYGATTVDSDTSAQVKLYGWNGQICVKGIDQPAVLSVFDMSGRLIKQMDLKGECLVPVGKGLWIAKLVTATQTISQIIRIN